MVNSSCEDSICNLMLSESDLLKDPGPGAESFYISDPYPYNLGYEDSLLVVLMLFRERDGEFGWFSPPFLFIVATKLCDLLGVWASGH